MREKDMKEFGRKIAELREKSGKSQAELVEILGVTQQTLSRYEKGDIPVATVAINGGKNAGILAAKILAASDPELLSRLKAYSEKMKNEVVGKAEKLDKTGYKEYLASMKK